MENGNRYSAKRLRRLRSSSTLRNLVAQVKLSRSDFVAPIFVRRGKGVVNPIASMPGQNQYSVDTALEYARRLYDKGIHAVLIFGVTDDTDKDETGTMAWQDDAPAQELCSAIKKAMPEMVVIMDTCLCEYTSHGHCGPVYQKADGSYDVDNDAALELLAKVALSQARAGADIVAPSAMMDNQVAAIREALEADGYINTVIMSYSVKFASNFYGPFRDAAQSPPQFGDRKTYQMDYRCGDIALEELKSDIDQGADMVMVKPALAYLDIITKMRQHTTVPLVAYHVSGEYAMIKSAAEKGWLDEQSCVLEAMTAIKRAGADIIITYFAEQLADWLGQGDL